MKKQKIQKKKVKKKKARKEEKAKRHIRFSVAFFACPAGLGVMGQQGGMEWMGALDTQCALCFARNIVRWKQNIDYFN
jgi:hypothetical protein